MKIPKAIRVIYSVTTLAVWILTAAAMMHHSTPPPIDYLPGRPAAVMAPTVASGSIHCDTPWLWNNCHTLDAFLRAGQHVEAAHSPKLSNATANLAADTVAALFNSCYLKIYDGTQAATADTSIGAQVLLATPRCNSTAFGSASSGVATANAFTSDTDAAATGTATWFRVLKSDNSTVIMDGSVGTSGADINLATVSIAQHATVTISSFTFTQSKS